ncbi:AI-2E family transporter [Desulfitobacterium sp.]|uniref:AI-2E family transporter n=1 Tax=Desulfitobacterium sp. TaxID=49981 RepID=UPI002B21460D|nr:AI-2E family transporter [Desulfitobacterium sp.]MEA4901755.1 AI-2E family transporter [Desulfitobacterium sp.]
MLLKITNEDLLKKIASFGILILIAYLLKDMANLFLLTFIFSFILYSLQNFIFHKIKSMNINRTEITVTLFLVIITAAVFFLFKYIPVLIKQCITIGNQFINFKINYQGEFDPRIVNMVQSTIESYVKSGGSFLLQTAGSVWTFSLDTFIALILSLFFILGKEPLLEFIRNLESSHIGFAIKFYRKIGASFLGSFGKVMQVQILIALINSLLSVIILFILGFPQVLGLGFMIFMLGLIPVAGVIISLIPLSIIAYKLGGFIKVIYVFALIIVLHALESYVLNPKLMSVKTKLPVFLTFVILIISQHFFGIWGLLFGVPMFIFLLDLLDVKTINSDKKQNAFRP